MICNEELNERLNWPLQRKIEWSETKIVEWYDKWQGNVYISFSGGKDSTALLHLVRSLYPHVHGVYCDTGLEFPEIRDFVKTIDNIEWLKPKLTFQKVIEKHGYPIISKKVARFVRAVRKSPDGATARLRLTGMTTDGRYLKNMLLPKKWRFLVDAPFDTSDECCYIFKKGPFRKYEQQTGKKGISGDTIGESSARRMSYRVRGCNSTKRATPIAIWTQDNVWDYIKTNNVPYCPIYDMGYCNTGCIFCGFGCHLEKYPNRFQLLKQTHPKLWDYCINKLGLGEVLKYCGIEYE